MYTTDNKVIVIAIQVLLSGISFKKKSHKNADSIGAIATIISVFATLVF